MLKGTSARVTRLLNKEHQTGNLSFWTNHLSDCRLTKHGVEVILSAYVLLVGTEDVLDISVLVGSSLNGSVMSTLGQSFEAFSSGIGGLMP